MHVLALSLQPLLRIIDQLIVGRPVVSLLLLAAALFVLAGIVQRVGKPGTLHTPKPQALHRNAEDGSI